MNLNEILNWRYSTKKFDETKPLSDKQITNLLELTNLSASSYGLQPFKMVVVKDKEVKTSKPIDVVKKSTIPKQTGLYRDIPQDKRVTDRIYYNGKYYTVQVSSWRTVKIAEREVNRYRNFGFDAFIYQVFIKSKGGTWNRVRIGYFNSKDEAEEFIQSNKL